MHFHFANVRIESLSLKIYLYIFSYKQFEQLHRAAAVVSALQNDWNEALDGIVHHQNDLFGDQ